ncbi:MAG: BTAD domain-containing putative transcriptional regulator [Deinococcales bacterium]
MMIKGYFLGQPRLVKQDDTREQVIKLHSRQGLALLAYLLEQDAEVSRAQLIELLWPEEEAPFASGSFRVMLSKIKRVLPGALDITRYTVKLNRNTIQWDTQRFIQLAQQGDLNSLRQATALYRGEFMQGFVLNGSAEFQTWLEEQRENWIESHNQVMRRLVDGLLEQHEMAKAIQHVDRWIKLEPWQERAHRQRMWLYWQTGEVDKALQHYRQYARQIERELGAEPSEDTSRLYETIMQDKQDSFQELIRLRTSAPSLSSSVQQDPSEVYQLNDSLTSFVGRESEMDQLKQLLEQHRIVTIRGAGGVGKTRLALQIPRSPVAKRYKDGVMFIALERANSGQLVSQIARRLGVDEDESALVSYLKDKEMLLILDSFEHLLSTSGFIMTLLRQASKVSLLITSREVLGLMGEQYFVLKGLDLPTNDSEVAVDNASTYSALKLFAQRASLQDPDFELDAERLPLVLRICRKLSGMPLPIELVASWLGMMSVQEIAAELANDLNLLQTDSANVLDRHRDMAQVFQSAWQQLNPELQQVYFNLTRLSEYFSKDEAGEVANASLSNLRTLVDKSLLNVERQEGNLRYHFPQLLQAYAEEIHNKSVA